MDKSGPDVSEHFFSKKESRYNNKETKKKLQMISGNLVCSNVSGVLYGDKRNSHRLFMSSVSHYNPVANLGLPTYKCLIKRIKHIKRLQEQFENGK